MHSKHTVAVIFLTTLSLVECEQQQRFSNDAIFSSSIQNSIGWPSYMSGQERGGTFSASPPDLGCLPCDQISCGDTPQTGTPNNGSPPLRISSDAFFSSPSVFAAPTKINTCRGGLATDMCNCCLICAKVRGERCGGENNFLGKCDVGLKCVSFDRTSMDANEDEIDSSQLYYDPDNPNHGVCWPDPAIPRASKPTTTPSSLDIAEPRSAAQTAPRRFPDSQQQKVPFWQFEQQNGNFENAAAHRRVREGSIDFENNSQPRPARRRHHQNRFLTTSRDSAAGSNIERRDTTTASKSSSAVDFLTLRQEVCRPACTPDFCARHPKDICSARVNADVSQTCAGQCQHTSCKACRMVEPPPEQWKCPRCRPDDFKCLKQYGRCVKKHLCMAKKNLTCHHQNSRTSSRRHRRQQQRYSTTALSSEFQFIDGSTFQCLVPDCR